MYDVIFIGAGPGGYVGAIRAAQLGLKVAIVEKEPVGGGTCLRVGCIPSKALLESSEFYHKALHSGDKHGIKFGSVELNLGAMLRRKDSVVKALTKGVEMLLKKNKVDRLLGTGRLVAAPGQGETQVEVKSEDGSVQNLAGKNVIIATGSVPTSLPGIEMDYDRVGTSTEAINYPEVPKHLVVIGAGVIGLELGSVWSRLGAKVTVVEYLDRILPGMDNELAQAAHKVFVKQGFEFHLGQKVTGAKVVGDGVCRVEAEGGLSIECDRVLVCVGRRPNTEGLGEKELNIAMDRGRVVVDEQFRTNVPGIFAIGDVIRGPMLAHKAEEEGTAVAEFLATGRGHVNYDVIPGIVYTHPELASVGKTEEELKAQEIPYRKGSFPFIGNGRARAMDDIDGWVKILAHAETDRVLGVHIIGPRAGDLIAECALAMEFSASSEDIARTCHAHPTLSEVVREAALGVDGRSIHI